MTYIIQAFLIVSLLVFAGCSNTQPNKRDTFNPNQQFIVFEAGKPYRIPNKTTYMPVLYSENVKKYHYFGFTDCKIGDLGWMEKNIYKEYISAVRNRDYKTSKMIETNAARTNKLGCVPTLSNREYEYYKNLEKEESANRRARMYYNANTEPVTVNHNVQHTGNIYIQ